VYWKYAWTHGDNDFWYNLKKSILRVFFQNLQVQLNHCSELPTFKETKNDFGCLPNIFVLTETVLYFLETKPKQKETKLRPWKRKSTFTSCAKSHGDANYFCIFKTTLHNKIHLIFYKLVFQNALDD
jgi:hypothetical protein